MEIVGLPAPQGSKTRMPNGALVEGGSAAGRQRHADWRTAVATATRQACAEHGITTPIDVAVDVACIFRLPMPASRKKSIRELGVALRTGKPDVDKLLRSTFDGLKAGGLISDDARIASGQFRKVEVVGWTGAVVTVWWHAP